MITIINYGVGNFKSIKNMLSKLHIESTITSDYHTIQDATALIFPGVGAFDGGMERLRTLNLLDCLNEKVLVDKVPILGICLGMQLMARGSEEGKLPGFGWIDADVVHLKTIVDKKVKIPHMGWNMIKWQKTSVLNENFPPDPRFYFVHSYALQCRDQKAILATCDYAATIPIAVEHENIFGVQFHPEKSHQFGMALLQRFCQVVHHETA